jgi:hypothetical protein
MLIAPKLTLDHLITKFTNWEQCVAFGHRVSWYLSDLKLCPLQPPDQYAHIIAVQKITETL